MSKEDNSSLFRVLERGDRTIQTSHETAIALVGLTRAGKSTTFNWMLGRPMVGKGDEIDAYYENVVSDAKTAELGNTFTSVTLCPNIVEFDKENKVTIMDMAGYRDKRNYIGVLGVSYFLKAVFERVQRVKFLIVIDEQKLTEKSGDGVIGTFTGFLNMFNLKELPARERTSFYASISMVVTRSENPTKHQAYLRRISTMVADDKLHVENKEEVVALIKDIIDNNRIEAFPVAIANKNPPKCDFIERFHDLGWNYLDVASIESQIKTDLISLPFAKDFAELDPAQKELFNACIQQRVNSYIHFAKIINTLIQGVRQGWQTALEENTGQLSLNLSRCEDFIEGVSDFLEKNDFYTSEDLVPRVINAEYKPLNFVRTVKQVLAIFKIGDEIGLQENDKFIESMEYYTHIFGELINAFVPFASNANEEHLLRRLTFIIRRGFRDFSKLYQLNDRLINDVNRKMKDNLSDVFDKRKEFIEIIITKIDAAILPFLFTNLEDLLEYEELFNDYQSQFYSQQEPIFFSRHRYYLESAKAVLYLANYKQQRGLHCYLRAYRYLCEIAFNASHSYDQQEEAEPELNGIHMKKLVLVGSINSILKTFKDSPDVRNIALTLSKYIKDIHETCEIYELIIADAEPAEKPDFLDQYADYCLEWGRIEQANALLQRKLSLERTNFEAYMATIKKLSTLVMDKSHYAERYADNLSSWTRLPEDDPVINGYIADIEYYVPDQ